MNTDTSRREFLGTVGLGLASACLGRNGLAAETAAPSRFEAPVSLPEPLKPFKRIPVADGHFHLHGTLESLRDIENLPNVMDACAVETVNILATTARLERLNENFNVAAAKAAHPSRVYASGSLMYQYPGTDPRQLDLGEQARALTEIGFDGFKMHEGKPVVRDEVGMPMDDPKYDAYWDHLEANQIPLVWHVADPWSGPEPPPEMERVYSETESVLNKFPKLPVIFAHFYFYAHVLHKAADFMERFPTVSFDLTPHGGMYSDFSANPERARDFFIEHQDRIVFGTDNHGEPRSFGPGAPLEYWPVHKIIAMRKFLETDEEFRGWHRDLRGIALPDDVLQKIYYKNYQRYAGPRPKPLDVDKTIAFCERIVNRAKRYGVMHQMVFEAENCMQALTQIRAKRKTPDNQ